MQRSTQEFNMKYIGLHWNTKWTIIVGIKKIIFFVTIEKKNYKMGHLLTINERNEKKLKVLISKHTWVHWVIREQRRRVKIE